MLSASLNKAFLSLKMVFYRSADHKCFTAHLFAHEKCMTFCLLKYKREPYKHRTMSCPVSGMVHIKGPLLLSERVANEVAAMDFRSRYLSRRLRFVRRYVNVNKIC